ncbi:MAG: hypothetical protein NPIRA04_03260 [Nitrospirales bacterium]|nr:MAG: hypothetical protein NPIRA04_03260 [Nitrospirales bacterium]
MVHNDFNNILDDGPTTNLMVGTAPIGCRRRERMGKERIKTEVGASAAGIMEARHCEQREPNGYEEQ